MKASSVLSAFLFIILLWWVLAKILSDEVLLPAPDCIFAYLAKTAFSLSFWSAIYITFLRVIEGTLLAFLFGTMLGIFAGTAKSLYPFLRGIMSLLQVLPPVSWILLAMIWLGVGGGPPILAMVLGLLPVIFYNMAEGVRFLSGELFEVVKVFKINRLKAIRKVFIPAMLPFIISALSYSLGTAWKICITAELLASSKGIGARMGWARLTFDTVELMAWTLVVLIIGVSLELIFQKLLKKAWYALET